MAQIDMQQMECILAQLLEFESSLRKKEITTRSKIAFEHGLMEKITLRRDFYKKLEANMIPKQDETINRLKVVEEEIGRVQDDIKTAENEEIKLQSDFSDVIAQNERDVIPELERLKHLLKAVDEEVTVAKRACENQEQSLLRLRAAKQNVVTECDDLFPVVQEKELTFLEFTKPKSSESEIMVFEDQTNVIQSQIIDADYMKKKVVDEIVVQKQRKDELQKKIIADQKKLDLDLMKCEGVRQDLDDQIKALAEERIRQHSLATIRAEIEMKSTAEVDSQRRNSNFILVDKRQLNSAKNSLIKSLQTTSRTKELIPQLERKLSDLEHTLSNLKIENSSLISNKSQMRSKLDDKMLKFHEQEDIDVNLARQLDASAKLVADQEADVDRWRAEEKKARLILAVTREKQAAIRRKVEHEGKLKSEIEHSIRLQQILEIDSLKKSKEAATMAKKLSSLHEVIVSENLQCTRLIQISHQALIDMRQKCSDLQDHLKTLASERDDKNRTLRVLRNEIEASREAWASSRRNKSSTRGNNREKLIDISKGEVRIENLKASLLLTRGEAERLEAQLKEMTETKSSLIQQLDARKAHLASLFNMSNLYAESLQKGMSCKQLEEEIKLIELKNNDVKRTTDLLKTGLRDPGTIKEKIERAKRSLELQIIETERISIAMESPNQERVRTLEGNDPSEEELSNHGLYLESIERNNREILRNKEIEIKDISKAIEELQNSSDTWTASTQSLLKDINTYQGQLHDQRRVRTALTSELRMYSSLIEELNASKVDLEQNITLRDKLVPDAEKYSFVSCVSPATKKHLRPTAYLPNDEEVVKVPRPFGAMAPFQPTEPGSSMRHIRRPRPQEVFCSHNYRSHHPSMASKTRNGEPKSHLGKRVGHYELGETLGEGTFGKVKKAVHVESGKEFAIKVIDMKQIEKQNMGDQLKREIAIMKMIRSPHIVEFYECLASKSKVYLVLELVTGGELFDLLVKERKFSERKTRGFFRQLLEGVKCCHKKGVAHRDLKPENLLLDSNGTLKISDFGLSALQNNCNEGATMTSSKFLHTVINSRVRRVGGKNREPYSLVTTPNINDTRNSPNYVSPEVISENPKYDGRKSDIWTMGVILYVMATGCLPFQEKSQADLFQKIKSAQYRKPSGVSESLVDLISQILVAEPCKRLSLEDIQNHGWYSACEDMATE